MKKSLFALFLSALPLSIGFAQTIDTVYVKNFAVNIRTGPGMDYDKAGVVFVNAPLKVISLKNGWFEIIVGDTLDGWISQIFTSYTPLSVFQTDKIQYHDGDMDTKMAVIAKMVNKHSGPEFNFLCDIILNHHNYDMGPEADRILLPQIFTGWADNYVAEAIPVLSFVMEKKLTGQIASPGDPNREVILSAKNALKKLVRQ